MKLSNSRTDMFGNLLLDYQDSPTVEFKSFVGETSCPAINFELQRLEQTVPENQRERFGREMNGFKQLFQKFVTQQGTSVNWEKIEKLPEDAIINYSQLLTPHDKEVIKQMLNELVVIKLNGALASPIGCSGPTSAIPVRNDLTALDLTVQQIEHLNRSFYTDVPLVLMNSFLTGEETEKIIRKYSSCRLKIFTFNQSCYPRVHKETLMPVPKKYDYVNQDSGSWYPPGHGDFYQSFFESGLLNSFISMGKKVSFISNMDNLGASVDIKILNMMKECQHEFLMEVTEKTRADVKGGTLINYMGRLRLLEVAQVPKEQLDDFMSVKKFNVFNTNNIWLSMEAIQRVVTDKALDMEVIVNPVSVGKEESNLYQLVTAIGAAMKCFENSVGLQVPRSRYLPVKKASDLLLVMSNLYDLDRGTLVMSPKRMFPSTPLVKLSSKQFSKVEDILNRFGSIPSLLELDHLTVSGDVTFGKLVSLKGTVIIIANHGDRIDLPSGTVIENKTVSGNMRILDH